MKERAIAYQHETARKRCKKDLEIFSKRTGIKVKELKFPFHLQDEPEVVIVSAGDGSVRAVTDELLTKENPPTLLLMPCGSQNGFYWALVDAGSTVQMDENLERRIDDLKTFHPGEINGRAFNHFTGWGKLEILHRQNSENLRKKYIPRKSRMYLAGVLSIVSAIKTKEEIDPAIRIVLTSPFVGSLKLLPQQNLYSDNLAEITVSGGSRLQTAIRLTSVLLHAVFGKTPPGNLVAVEYKRAIHEDSKIEAANADGEFIQLTGKEIEIYRSLKGIKAGAII
ncbi:MAG: hypothetical protein M1524_03370 [Patescibacteria group bacterium]|nr:hypothetical protein [Patescibacteria group bacterium]